MGKFRQFLTEVGDRATIPSDLKMVRRGGLQGTSGWFPPIYTSYIFTIGSQKYDLRIHMYVQEGEEEQSRYDYAISISFDAERPKGRTYDLTNQHRPLEVMSAITGAVKQFIQTDLPKMVRIEFNIVQIEFEAKAEEEGDRRREHLYRKVLQKQLESIGIRGKIGYDKYGENVIVDLVPPIKIRPAA